MAKKFDPADLKPCRHMRTLVSAWVDGKLTGVALWYTRWHVGHCAQCQASLPFLRGLHTRLLNLGTPPEPEEEALTPDRWARVEAAWAQSEGEQHP